MKIYYILIIFILLPILCISQNNNQSISGYILDENGNGIPFASAVLYNTSNDTNTQDILDYCSTNEEGYFILEADTIFKKIELVCNYLGYKKYSTDLNLNSKSPLKIQLTKDVYVLSEAIVLEDKLPVTISNDTTTYNASSFRDSTENKVVDLLEKIPGVIINKDGQISVDGRPIKKVLIEDSDMFGGKYTIGTENLSADYIESIEIINNYQENSILRDIQNTEDIVINLTLIEDAKNNITGNAFLEAGYGDEVKGALDATLFSISKKNKFIFISNNGNVGTHYGIDEIQATYSFSNNDPLTGSINEPLTFVNELRSQSISIDQIFTDNAVNTFNTLRSYFDINNLKININTTFSSKKDVQNSKLYQESFLDNTSYFIDVDQNLDFQNLFAEADLKVSHLNKNESQSVDFFLKFGKTNHTGDLNNNSLQSSISNLSQVMLEDFNVFSSFIFSKRFTKKNILHIKTKYGIENANENFFSNNTDFSNFYSFENRFQSINQGLVVNRIQSLFSLKYIQKLKFATIAGSSSLSNTNLKIENNNSIDNLTGETFTSSNTISLDYKENWQWQNTISLQKSFNKGVDASVRLSNFHIINAQDFFKTKFTLDESISFAGRLKKKHSRSVQSSYYYNYFKKAPSNQIFFQFLSGNFDLKNYEINNKLESGHIIRFDLSTKKFRRLTSFFAGINLRLNEKKWVKNISFYESIRSTTPIFTDNNNQARLYLKWEKFFSKAKTTVRILPSFSLAKTEFSSNSVIKSITNLSSNIAYQFSYRLNEIFLLNCEGNFESQYFSQANTTNKYLNVSVDPSISGKFKNFEVVVSLSYFNSKGEFSNNSYWGSMLKMNKPINLKNSKVNISLKVNNLLNIRSYDQIERSEFFLVQNSVEAILPFFLLGIDFNL
jgi:hypothetical protein